MASSDAENDRKEALKLYARYGSMVFTLLAQIAFGVIVGQWIDDYFALKTPYITLVLVFLMLGIAFYGIYKKTITE